VSGSKPSSGLALDALCMRLAEHAPLRLAEPWDNVGLLAGDRSARIERVMTCLTITPAVAAEAVREGVDLVVTHHPLPFKPLQRITSDSTPGGLLLRLLGAGAAIYSAHTAFDSAADGINQMWAERLGLSEIRPLVEFGEQADRSVPPNQAGSVVSPEAASNTPAPSGSGRYGRLPSPMPLEAFVRLAAETVGATLPRRIGPPDRIVSRVAFACGSGGSFLSAAARRGCDALLTGEATFHTCLEAEASGVGLGLIGHYWSERFAMETLAARLSDAFPGLTIWPSRDEADPLRPVVLPSATGSPGSA